MQKKEVEKEVLAFVKRKLLSKNESASLQTSINIDIGIVGTEAYDFMADFGENFRVDLSNFEVDLYFEREPNLLLLPLFPFYALYRFIFLKNRKERKIIPLRISDLVKSVEVGEWVPQT